MKRNNDKISSKYRFRWFGPVTEVKPGTATIGNFRRLRPVQSAGSVRLPFLPPTLNPSSLTHPTLAQFSSAIYHVIHVSP